MAACVAQAILRLFDAIVLKQPMASVVRPSISHPDALSPAALADARRHQPVRGLIGLAFVIPVTALLSFGTGEAVHSLTLLAPIITFALPMIAMIAFWWEDWPGTLLPRPWSGLYDTVIITVGGLLLSVLGQLVINGGDLIGVFAPGPAHSGLHPFGTLLAGSIFTILLQLTLVCERWPFDGLDRIPAGLAAVALCWGVGLIAWLIVVRTHAVEAEEYGAVVTSIGAWQMLFYVSLRGWPFARIDRKWLRLLLGNVIVITCGWASCLLAVHVLGWPATRITATAGIAVGCILLVTMLFEAWPAIEIEKLALGRTVAVMVALLLTALLIWLLPMLARAVGVSEAYEWSWTTHVMLNALSTAIILHVAVWRRWPAKGSREGAR